MKLTLTRDGAFADWHLIEKAESPDEHREWQMMTKVGRVRMHSARLGNADIEGDACEMRAIANAIVERTEAQFTRCAVKVYADGSVAFWSPRNSTFWELVSLQSADELAAQIRQLLCAQ